MALVRDQSYIRGLEKALKLQCGEVDSFKCFIIREMGDSLGEFHHSKCVLRKFSLQGFAFSDFISSILAVAGV